MTQYTAQKRRAMALYIPGLVEKEHGGEGLAGATLTLGQALPSPHPESTPSGPLLPPILDACDPLFALDKHIMGDRWRGPR